MARPMRYGVGVCALDQLELFGVFLALLVEFAVESLPKLEVACLRNSAVVFGVGGGQLVRVLQLEVLVGRSLAGLLKL